jgi:hypothetical protein
MESNDGLPGIQPRALPPPKCQLIKHLIERYRRELGLSSDVGVQASQIAEAASLAVRTVQTIIGTGPRGPGDPQYREPSAGTVAAIGEWFSRRILWFEPEWLAQDTLEELDQKIARAHRDTVDIPISIRARADIADDLQRLSGMYISYRYAFEPGDVDQLWVREVIVFERDHVPMPFKMSFRVGPHDPNKDLQLFQGYILPLGNSLMCLGVHNDRRNRDLDRSRCLFLNRSVFAIGADGDARFGILASTRAQGNFEPMAACILLLRVIHEPAAEELAEFMRQCTIICPRKEIIEHDFKGITHEQQMHLYEFLDNVPRGNISTNRLRDYPLLQTWH